MFFWNAFEKDFTYRLITEICWDLICVSFREGFQKTKWKFKMDFFIKRQTPPPPPTVGQEAVELICQNARKMRQNAAMSLWPLLTTKMKLICMEVLKKMTFSQKTFLTLSMVTLANRGHKTASRAEPIFWGQTDLTQWCHISPISWGNSGYINPYAKYNKCWCWINSTA